MMFVRAGDTIAVNSDHGWPAVAMKVDNPYVASIDGTVVRALSPGQATIESTNLPCLDGVHICPLFRITVTR
jgi:hypothetical protein